MTREDLQLKIMLSLISQAQSSTPQTDIWYQGIQSKLFECFIITANVVRFEKIE